MAPPYNCSAGLKGPGDGRKGEGRSARTKASSEGRKWHLKSRERGESPQLKVESMGKGDCGGNRVLPGPGGVLVEVRCKCNLEIRECDGVLENESVNEQR